jgi:hypothetical protein
MCGPRNSDYTEYCLLGCDAVQPSTFLKNLLPPPSVQNYTLSGTVNATDRDVLAV